jgi:hypothetical protein
MTHTSTTVPAVLNNCAKLKVGLSSNGLDYGTRIALALFGIIEKINVSPLGQLGVLAHKNVLHVPGDFPITLEISRLFPREISLSQL